jgi:hypothetical protein
VALSAVATFFVLLYAIRPTGSITKNGTRLALTGTFTLTYFILLGLFVFFQGDAGASEITKTLVTNFTFLMGCGDRVPLRHERVREGGTDGGGGAQSGTDRRDYPAASGAETSGTA